MNTRYREYHFLSYRYSGR